MTFRFMLIACVVIAGCGAVDPNGPPAAVKDTRQIPSNYEPGIHISGYATVGVERRF